MSESLVLMGFPWSLIMPRQERRARLIFHNDGSIELAITRKHKRNYATQWYAISPEQSAYILQRMGALRIGIETNVLDLQGDSGVWVPCNFATVVFFGGYVNPHDPETRNTAKISV